jgi:hypothetical protein
MKSTNVILPDIYSKNSFVKEKGKIKFNKSSLNRGILINYSKNNKRD